MHYNFFDYKYNIENFTSDMFSISHIVFIGLSFILVPLSFFFLRKAKHKGIDIFLKVFSIFFLVFEVAKITWESYYDITTGRGFNTEGLIPVYTCSLFIYTMLGAAWGKGKIRDYSLAYLTTISFLSGAIGIVYCRGLTYYPFWTFGGFYSLFFHLSMFAVGTLLLMTKYKKLEWKDMIRAWFPLVILSFISTPINYVYGADYMQTYSATGVPLLSKLADILASHNLRYLFTIIMTFLYIPMAGIAVCIVKPFYWIGAKISKKKGKGEASENEQSPVQEMAKSEDVVQLETSQDASQPEVFDDVLQEDIQQDTSEELGEALEEETKIDEAEVQEEIVQQKPKTRGRPKKQTANNDEKQQTKKQRETINKKDKKE